VRCRPRAGAGLAGATGNGDGFALIAGRHMAATQAG
jgi:hypothetical protein